MKWYATRTWEWGREHSLQSDCAPLRWAPPAARCRWGFAAVGTCRLLAQSLLQLDRPLSMVAVGLTYKSGPGCKPWRGRFSRLCAAGCCSDAQRGSLAVRRKHGSPSLIMTEVPGALGSPWALPIRCAQTVANVVAACERRPGGGCFTAVPLDRTGLHRPCGDRAAAACSAYRGAQPIGGGWPSKQCQEEAGSRPQWDGRRARNAPLPSCN